MIEPSDLERPETAVDPTAAGAAMPITGGEVDVLAGTAISGRRRFFRRFRRNRGAVAALVFLLLLVLVAIFCNIIRPMDPNQQDLAAPLADPFSEGHLLGTDELGRDTLSRLIVATRVALLFIGQTVSIAVVLGVPLGLIAGYFGGFVDLTIMRLTDALQSLPPLILALAVAGILGPGLTNAAIAIGIVFAPNFLRIIRGAVLEVREETFIEASRSIGTPTARIIRTRILPNVLPPLLVQISLAAGFCLLAEASLSFLGLGPVIPQASWGSMLQRGYLQLARQPWLIVIPGILIALTVLAFNVLGDGLRDSIGRESRRER